MSADPRPEQEVRDALYGLWQAVISLPDLSFVTPKIHAALERACAALGIAGGDLKAAGPVPAPPAIREDLREVADLLRSAPVPEGHPWVAQALAWLQRLEVPGPLSYFHGVPAPPEREVWRPLTTAPKDGTTVLLALNDYKIASVDFGWFTDHWRNYEGDWLAPTHWMPLPDPPSALQQEGSRHEEDIDARRGSSTGSPSGRSDVDTSAHDAATGSAPLSEPAHSQSQAFGVERAGDREVGRGDERTRIASSEVAPGGPDAACRRRETP